jgi:hypothetical protein
MQVENGSSVCPICGTAALEFFPVLHHLICAYVGPEYDYGSDAGIACPKCEREIVSGDPTCEVLGTSARCRQCHVELPVTSTAGRT